MLTNSKNNSFSSGQGVVQIEPNSEWSISFVGRVQDKKIALACLRKKLFFHMENFEFH